VLTESLVREGIRGHVRLRIARAGVAGLLAAALVVCACAKVPIVGGKPSVKVAFTATPDCNSCGRPTGYPLTVRLLQVSDASAMTGVTLAQLWDREDKVMGAALIAKTDDVIDPGTRKEWKVETDSKARAVIVVGNFCRAEGTCWYLVKPLKGGGASLKVALEASCLRETR
jgi:type VI secretion system VasD/TssJ family lipoprotein